MKMDSMAIADEEDIQLKQELEGLLSKAIELQQQWRFDEAKIQYEAILKKVPEDADTNHNMGVLFAVQLLQPQAALPYLEAALSADPMRLQFWFSYLDALIKAEALDVAEQVLLLASSYGLGDLRVNSLRQDIRLARGSVEELARVTLAAAPALPESIPFPSAEVAPGKDPAMGELQQLLNLLNRKEYEQTVKAANDLSHRFSKSAIVWVILGDAQRLQGDMAAALFAKQQAVRLQPANISAQLAVADALMALGRLDEAQAVVQRVFLSAPDDAQVNGRMGLLQKQQGKLEEAAISYARALQKNYQDPVFLEKFGSIQSALGNENGALVCFKASVQASPHSSELQDAYGQTLVHHNRLAAAEDAFRRALLIHPGNIAALKNLCHLLETHGRFLEAEAGLKHCSEIEGDKPDVLYEIGRNLVGQKREKEALDWLRRAIQGQPDLAVAHVMLSVALAASEEPSTALEEINASLKVLPKVPQLHTNKGIVNLMLSRCEEAIACFRAALALNPNLTHARSSLLFAMSHSTQVSVKALTREHMLFGELMAQMVKGKVHKTYANTRDPNRPLRVGFVSADFRNHAMAKFVIPFFEDLAQSKEVISYAYVNHGANDHSTQLIQSHINVWRSVLKWSDERLVQQIREDEIDILVDMSGHTAGHRLGAFACHPAPVQVTWGGYPGTTGLAAMDYRFAEHFFLKSEGLRTQFTEKFVQLPAVSTFNGLEVQIDVEEAPCLKNGYITFGSFNRLNKISREVIAAWCRVLKALPDSRFVMAAMPTNGVPPEVLGWFEQEGVDLQRITFHPRTHFAEYLRLHAQVDLCLDTFPFTGGTTTNHALWMGVPTLTIAGETYQSRQSAVFLRRVGLERVCVAENVNSLVAHAVTWAQQPEKLNQVRLGLQAYLIRAHATQREVTVKGVVQAMRHMWQHWCSGRAPEGFKVEYEDIGMTPQPSLLGEVIQ